MEVPKLNLSSLKEKVASSLASQKENNKKQQLEKDKRKKQSDRDKKTKDLNRQSNSDRRSNERPNSSYNDRRSNERPSNNYNNTRNSNGNRGDFKPSNDRRSNDRRQGNLKSNDRKQDYSKKSNNRDVNNSKNFEPQLSATASGSNGEPNKESKAEILRREALELGASEDDIALLADIEDDDDELSEQEFDGTDSKIDDKLAADLSKFIKGIGLGDSKVDDLIAEEEDEVPELVKEDEEDEPETFLQEQQDDEEEEDDEAPFAEEPESLREEIAKPVEEPKPPNQGSNKDKINNLQTVITDKLIVPARNDWFAIPLGKLPLEGITHKLSPQEVESLFYEAQGIVENENTVYYEEFNKSSSQKRFLSQILGSGTLNDKISALTLLIQEAPLHNIKALDNMFGMCEKKSRTAALQCLDALVDLFVNGILPPDRKLKYFNKQPLSKNLSQKQLAIFYFEDYLKKLYFKFIGILEKLSHDSITHVRTKIVGYLFDLLKAKPEQEANLLRLGVNKLGDIDNKVSSKTSYNVLLLEQQHPAMKQIVVDSVIDILFRKNNDQHAIYYSCLALNQTIITKKEETLANKLVDAYFALFEKMLIETDSHNTSKLKDSDYQKDGRRKRNFKKGKKGGKSVKDDKTEEEVNEEKDSKLFAAILTGLNRAFPFSNLPQNVFESHLSTLFKITHSTNFNTSVQALLLIHNIIASPKQTMSSSSKDRFYRTLYESLLDERLLTSSKQGIYLNLLFKSLKEDDDKARVMSFVKRICQICLSWINIGTVSGMIFLLIELEKTTPELRNLFYNTPMDDILNKREADAEAVAENGADEVPATEAEKQIDTAYDPRKRDPKFTNACKSSLWELNSFLTHYHPTVALYASALLDGPSSETVITKPDLGLFTLSHFLDRFVYKNAKKKPITRGSSIMQPLGGSQTGSLLVKATGDPDGYGANVSIPANTEDWINMKASQIKAEDQFFYQYFSTKQEKALASKIDKDINEKAKSDDFEDEEELDDDAVWNALVKSNPEVEGDNDDLDDDFSDFAADDFSDLDDDEEEEAANEEDIAVSDDEELDIGSDEEDGEGLVRLTTVEDLVGSGNEDDEIDEDEDRNIIDDDDSSDDEDIKGLLNDEDEAEFDSDEFEAQALGDSDDSDEEVYADESEEEEEVTFSQGKKRSTSDDKDDGKKRSTKKQKLPTFASADDYAKYLDSSDEDDS